MDWRARLGEIALKEGGCMARYAEQQLKRQEEERLWRRYCAQRD